MNFHKFDRSPGAERVAVAKRKPMSRSLTDVLRGLLPVPVREESSAEGVLLTAGDPGLVAVRLSDRGLAVSVFGVRWDGPHTPMRDDRELCALSWEEMPAELPEQVVAVHSLIQAAMVIRRSQFRVCRFCRESTPPEWQHATDVCQGCAERRLGVVH